MRIKVIALFMAFSGLLMLTGCGKEEVSEEKQLAGADEIVSALEVSLEENLTSNTEYGRGLKEFAEASVSEDGTNKVGEVGYNESNIPDYYTDADGKAQPNYKGYGKYYVEFFDGCSIEIAYGPISFYGKSDTRHVVWGGIEGDGTVDTEAGFFHNKPTAYNEPNFWLVVGPDCVTA